MYLGFIFRIRYGLVGIFVYRSIRGLVVGSFFLCVVIIVVVGVRDRDKLDIGF